MLYLFQQIFYLIVIIGFVSINDGACWHIKGGAIQISGQHVKREESQM